MIFFFFSWLNLKIIPRINYHYYNNKLSKKSFVQFKMVQDKGLFILDWHQFFATQKWVTALRPLKQLFSSHSQIIKHVDTWLVHCESDKRCSWSQGKFRAKPLKHNICRGRDLVVLCLLQAELGKVWLLSWLHALSIIYLVRIAILWKIRS